MYKKQSPCKIRHLYKFAHAHDTLKRRIILSKRLVVNSYSPSNSNGTTPQVATERNL